MKTSEWLKEAETNTDPNICQRTLRECANELLAIQPDSTALKTVIEAADSGSETLMPQGQQSEGTGNA